MTVPPFLWVYVLYVVVVIVFLLTTGAAAALKASDYPKSEIRHGMAWIVLLIAGWLALAIGLANIGAGALTLPGVRLAVGAAVAFVFGILIMRTPQGARIIHAVPQSWLVGVQAYRGLGSIFLILYGLDLMPGAFALPAGFGDAAVALFAIPVAAIYASGWAARERLVLVWNLFGIADLAVAATMGILTSPVVHAIGGPANVLLVSWPLILVPLFAVPLSVVLHIASLTKLAWDRELAQHAKEAKA